MTETQTQCLGTVLGNSQSMVIDFTAQKSSQFTVSFMRLIATTSRDECPKVGHV